MKKIILCLFITAALIPSVNAQFTKVGGGFVYTTSFHFNNEKTAGYEATMHRGPFLGIFVNGIYELKLPVHIAPSFTCFIPRHNTFGTSGEETRVSSMMFDLNGHYVFNSLDRFEFYGLTGLDIMFTKIKWIGTSSDNSDNAFGLNLGAGSYMKLTNQFDLFLEAKYIISKYDQFMLNAGILINLDWLIKHENDTK